MTAKGKGGKRPGAGRPKGKPNRRTLERQAEFAASGKTDPLQSQLDLHEWALREFKAACAALSAFEKKHGKTLATARIAIEALRKPEDIVLLDEHKRLSDQIDRFSGKIHTYAQGAMPFLHARLAATEANIQVTNHEAALEELDDDEED